jgi:asparagine synthase (glutamine-hydrolysing)
MGHALQHRGPDDDGAWADEQAGLAFAFRRLAIIDLSPAGHQPMLSADGRLAIVYNGEIYNHKQLRAELLKLGHAFRGHSDTEVLLAAISSWGVEGAARRASGMFAFALWDRARRELALVRDRLGVKPLYVGKSDGGTWLFASELKGLEAHAAFAADLAPEAIASFFAFSYVPTPLSVYRGIEKLTPGTILTIEESGSTRRTCYWDAAAIASAGLADPLRLTDAELAEAVDAEVGRAVGLRLEADVPLGAFLSGGVDSSLVVAHMQRQSPRPVRTFCIGSTHRGYDESPYAAAVAGHLGTDHETLTCTEAEALGVVPTLPDVYDEPFADSSQIPTVLVARLARRHVTVALSGDGGDEVFGGYNRYLWVPRVAQVIRRFVRLQGLARIGLENIPVSVWDAVSHAAAAGPGPLRIALLGEKLQKLARALPVASERALYDAVVRTFVEPPLAAERPSHPRLVALQRTPLSGLDWMMAADQVTYLPDDILAKVDRASMRVGLEAREPLLDHQLLAFAWRIPAAQRLRAGALKATLRRALDRHVPRALIERPKQGFGVPVEHWLRVGLRDLAEDQLSERSLAATGVLDVRRIRRLWARHSSGAGNHQHELWAVLMFQMWWQRARARAAARAPS